MALLILALLLSIFLMSSLMLFILSLHDALPILSDRSNAPTQWSMSLSVMAPFSQPLELPRLVSTPTRSEEHTSELQSHSELVCRLLLEKKKNAESAVWLFSYWRYCKGYF